MLEFVFNPKTRLKLQIACSNPYLMRCRWECRLTNSRQKLEPRPDHGQNKAHLKQFQILIWRCRRRECVSLASGILWSPSAKHPKHSNGTRYFRSTIIDFWSDQMCPSIVPHAWTCSHVHSCWELQVSGERTPKGEGRSTFDFRQDLIQSWARHHLRHLYVGT